MVINSYGKSPFEIRDSTGKEFKKIYDNQGRLLFKNWNEIQGSFPLQFKSYADYLKDYRIYGNIVQNGTPTPETPVEVQGVGEYDAELNCYKIPVTVSNGTNSVTTPVYIGSEPLYKIGDYADYVDFKRGVVVRKIRKIVLKGEENNNYVKPIYRVPISLGLTKAAMPINTLLICASHYITNESSEDSKDFKDVHTIRCSSNYNAAWFFIPKSFFSGEINKENCISQFKAYLATQYSSGTPVTVWYVIDEPQEEPLENLLPIQTIKGSDVLTADTTVQPSEIYIKGKIR